MVIEFYGDFVYKFRKIVGKLEFSDQFSKIVICYKRKGYTINVIKQSACSAINPITVDHFAYLFNCTPVSGIRLYDWPVLILFIKWSGPELFTVCFSAHGVQLVDFFCSSISMVLFDNQGTSKYLNTLFLLSFNFALL